MTQRLALTAGPPSAHRPAITAGPSAARRPAAVPSPAPAAPIALPYRGPAVHRVHKEYQVAQYRLIFHTGSEPPTNVDEWYDEYEAMQRTAPVEAYFNHLVASHLSFRVLIKITALFQDGPNNYYDFVCHYPLVSIWRDSSLGPGCSRDQ